MSFNFGQSSFGTTNKPAGFGTPFGANLTTTTTSAPSFGSFGSMSFGTPAASAAPTFGSTFGAPAATQAASGFGSTFGTGAVANIPTFGAGSAPAFGTGTASTTPAFGTGAAGTASAFGSTFGAPAQPQATPFFGTTFGAPASSAPSLFGTSKPSMFSTQTPTTAGNLFGTPSTSNLFGAQTTSGGLFGAPSLATQATGLFGATTTTTNSLFGVPQVSTMTTPSLFGGGGTGTSLFGNATGLSSGTGFGGLFGSGVAPATTQSLFGGFGTTTMTTSSGFGSFGATNTQVTQSVDSRRQQMLASVLHINIFGDERDEVLKKWNMLQACWGTGKGYYRIQDPPIEYDFTNSFYRFRAVGYVVFPQPENSDGFVKLTFKKKDSELNNQREALINGIAGILGNKPNLTVSIEHIKAMSDNEAEVMIYVSERGVTGTARRVHATDLTSFLNQPVQRQQLMNVGVVYIGPYMMPSRSQLTEYINVPPPGVEPQMWIAAQHDNPQPEKYFPSPMNGFYDLKKRMLCEEYEISMHKSFMDKVSKEIEELKKRQSLSITNINEQKQKFMELQHRLLKILVKQEATRKAGLALLPEEEMLKGRLETMLAQLNSPTQYKGQIRELSSSTKVLGVLKIQNNERYEIEDHMQDEIKQFLQMEQTGISQLVNIVNNDLKTLKIICDGLSQVVKQ